MDKNSTTELRLKLLAAGYDPVPAAGKRPLLKDWQKIEILPDTIRGWEASPNLSNTGIRCGQVVAIDIDILDGGLSERVKNLALQMLGDTSLVRIGRAPKQLMVYRSSAPARKRSVSSAPDMGAHKIEILGEGNQFIAFGVHPDTLQPYAWPEASPLDVPVHMLPEVTAEAVEAFLAAAGEMIGAKAKAAPEAAPEAPSNRSPLANGLNSFPPADQEEVLEALYGIPGDLEYDEWIRVGFALHAALGPSGFNHWAAWSARSSKNVPDVTAKKWPSFAQNRQINPATLFYIARDHGWRPAVTTGGPSIADASIFRAIKPPRHDPETGEVLEEDPEPDPEPEPDSPAWGFTPISGDVPAPRQFLYGKHYSRKFVSAVISPGGIGKSSLVLVEAMAMVSGRKLLDVQPPGRARVAYWNGEDPQDEIDRRAMAAAKHFGLSVGELDGLYLDSGRRLPIVLAGEGRNGPQIATPMFDKLVAAIRSARLDALIIDPFVSSHQVGENDNMAIDLVAKTWGRIADATNTSVMLVHHARKTNGEEVTVEAARGASALVDATRSARALNRMTKDEAEKFGVQNRMFYFRVDNGKSSMAPPAENATWFFLASVELNNDPLGLAGDQVGVVTAWEPPEAFDGVTAEHLKAVQNAVAAGRWRKDSRSSDWVGHVVVSALNWPIGKASSARAAECIGSWIASGALVVTREKDAKRMEREFVSVGNWVEK